MADPVVRIASGAWEANLLPALGGAILSLRLAGRDILRPSPDSPGRVLDTACFPLVPYANRIAHGRFAFEGRAVSLPRNFGDHPHSLHGASWQAAWTVETATPDRAVLVHDHDADAAWPWRYRAEQIFRLDDGGLSVTLAITNTDISAMPAGLGFHPYFPADATTTLQMATGGVWLSDAEQLPVRLATTETVENWAAGAPVMRSALVDHCFAGWDGAATLTAGAHRTTLSADGARFVHVHIPPHVGFVGIEPVSHMPDAVNRPAPPDDSGLARLAPGAAMRLTMRIAAC